MQGLSEDILVYVLMSMPFRAYHVLMYVCKRWYNIISKDISEYSRRKREISNIILYPYDTYKDKYKTICCGMLSGRYYPVFMKFTTARRIIDKGRGLYGWMDDFDVILRTICNRYDFDGANKYLVCKTPIKPDYYAVDIGYEDFAALFTQE